MTNSTSDFKSRTNDVFDQLNTLEKQHAVHTKSHTPVVLPDEDTPTTSQQNPTIPTHAITFKKRSADDETFTRPNNKWKKYDLDDVNEHHLGSRSNQHALQDFIRTRTKPSVNEKPEDEDELPLPLIFKRPLPKKPIVNTEDDDDQQFISIRAPITTETRSNNDDDNEVTGFKLPSNRTKTRGVLSTNEKKIPKPSMEISEEKDDDDADEDDDDDDELLLEP